MRKKAFTLVELLVVIAIIAMLLAILVPGLNGARTHVKTVVCQSNLRQIGFAIELYQQDNAGYAPFLGETFADAQCKWLEGKKSPEQMLSVYTSDNWEIWHCPADGIKPRKVWWPASAPNQPEVCNISYTWSEPLLRGFYPLYGGVQAQEWKPYKYHQKPKDLHVSNKPSVWLVIADGNRMLNVWDWRNALDVNYVEAGITYHCLEQTHSQIIRINRYYKVNLLYSDSRVETITCDPQTVKALPRF